MELGRSCEALGVQEDSWLPAAEIWIGARTPGIPDVLGWNLWWHLSTGISAHGDIHPPVWHDGTHRGVPASYLPTHISLSSSCWKMCLPFCLGWRLEQKERGFLWGIEQTGLLVPIRKLWRAAPATDASVLNRI